MPVDTFILELDVTITEAIDVQDNAGNVIGSQMNLSGDPGAIST